MYYGCDLPHIHRPARAEWVVAVLAVYIVVVGLIVDCAQNLPTDRSITRRIIG